MFAILAALLIALHAFGVRTGDVSLFELGLALWALHFGVGIALPWGRRRA